MKLKKKLIVLSEEYQKSWNLHYSNLNVNQAVMPKWSNVLNNANVQVIVLYFLEKFVREDPKNFELDMT